jgi:hypothetical protein
MDILWAVSSVGKGHVIRDMAIVKQLHSIADVEVDWLAPDPAGTFLSDRGYNVLACSRQLAGSGKVYAEVFKNCTDDFNLIDYTLRDTALHRHDFRISAQCWARKRYDIIVGDEAFWLLSGFSSRPSAKPAPFVFLTDFIGVKAMRPRIRDILASWYINVKYTMSHRGPDAYLYIGSADEIPAEPMGMLLPGRRSWAQRHCRFVKPIAGFEPRTLVDKTSLRRRLGLPEDARIFLAVVGAEGDYGHRTDQIQTIFARLREDFPAAHFILVGPARDVETWIHYHRYLDGLYAYFAASDFAFIQSGYGKVVELSALGVPFIALPLDYHFEQDYVMAHRLKHYGVGQLLTLRDHSPGEMAAAAKASLGKPVQTVPVDDGTEVSRILLDVAQTYGTGKVCP